MKNVTDAIRIKQLSIFFPLICCALLCAASIGSLTEAAKAYPVGDPTIQSNGAIAGRLVAGRNLGVPAFGVAGVKIKFTLKSGPSQPPFPSQVTTDSDGNFRATGFNIRSVYKVEYDGSPAGVTTCFKTQDANFGGNATVNLGDIAICSDFIARGSVTDRNGRALAGVTITFKKTTGFAPTPEPVITDSLGKFSHAPFFKGTAYIATPSLSGVSFQPASVQFTLAANSGSNTIDIATIKATNR